MEKELSTPNNLSLLRIFEAFYTVLKSPVELKERKTKTYNQEAFVGSSVAETLGLFKINLG